jgi:protein gp37
MAEHSKIEWTDATWNPVTGCTKITRGCDFCYAERFSERFRDVPGHPFRKEIGGDDSGERFVKCPQDLPKAGRVVVD